MITSSSDLDFALGPEGPVLVTLSTINDEARDALRYRHSLFLIESSSCTAAGITEDLQPYIEAAIIRLIQAADLSIGDDLQQVLDDGLYNPRLGALFEILWIARFEQAEHRDNDASVRELLRATFEDPSPLTRNDAILFWLTLLGQNEAPGIPIILVLTCVSPDPSVPAFIRSAEQWAGLGSPLRIVTGLS